MLTAKMPIVGFSPLATSLFKENIMKHKTYRKTTTSTAVKRRYNDKVYARVCAELDKDLVARFKEAVARNNDTTASVIRTAVEQYLADHELDKSNV